jgi:hypothetical protein
MFRIVDRNLNGCRGTKKVCSVLSVVTHSFGCGIQWRSIIKRWIKIPNETKISELCD